MDDKYTFRMELNSKQFECLVHHIYFHICNRTEIIGLFEMSKICAELITGDHREMHAG